MLIEVAIGAALGVAGPDPSVEVKWNKGWGAVEQAKGLPNPPGWYRAAVGPRSPEKVLHITFDDGPAPGTPSLLRALRRHDARATFFVTGAAARNNPAVIRTMRRDGHAIGNHTWSHPRLTEVSTARVRSELKNTGNAVGPAMGGCMRPPYGLVDRRVARASIGLGYQPVLWTAHIEDWSPHSTSWTVNRLRQVTSPGAVILMHDTHARTVEAVRTMLPVWKKQGYVLRAVPVCAR